MEVARSSVAVPHGKKLTLVADVQAFEKKERAKQQVRKNSHGERVVEEEMTCSVFGVLG